LHNHRCVFHVVSGTPVTILWEKAESELMKAEAATLTSDCKQQRILSGQSLRNYGKCQCLKCGWTVLNDIQTPIFKARPVCRPVTSWAKQPGRHTLWS